MNKTNTSDIKEIADKYNKISEEKIVELNIPTGVPLVYELNSKMSIRAAIASSSPFLGYGIAYKKKRIVYWLSNNHHFFLGNSPAIKINYAF